MANKHDPELKNKVLEEYANSADSIDVIAERHAVSRNSVKKWAREAALTRTKPIRRKRSIGNVFEGSPTKLKESEGAWVYDNHGIARWQPYSPTTKES